MRPLFPLKIYLELVSRNLSRGLEGSMRTVQCGALIIELLYNVTAHRIKF